MKLISIIFILILNVTLTCYSNTLNILSSKNARSRSMMNIVFLSGTDSSHIFYNANILNTFSQKNSASVNYELISMLNQNIDSPYSHSINASYSHSINNFAFGFGFASDIKQTSNLENTYLLAGGLSYKYNHSYFSATLKGVFAEENKEIETGIFLDINYMQTIFLPALRVGIGVHNLGFYKDQFALIDTDIVTGVAYHMKDGTFSVSLEYSIGITSYTQNIGISADVMTIKFNNFSFGKKETNLDDIPESVLDAPPKVSANSISGMSIRAGVSMEGISTGIGITLDTLKFDYAIVFEDFDFLSIDHNFGISYMF